MNSLRDRAAIVGIGQTAYSKGLGRSEFDMAVEAILAACADAGIAPREIDGVVRYDMETTDEEQLPLDEPEGSDEDVDPSASSGSTGSIH